MSPYCFKGWIYRRKLKYVSVAVHLIVPQSKFARSKMSPEYWMANGGRTFFHCLSMQSHNYYYYSDICLCAECFLWSNIPPHACPPLRVVSLWSSHRCLGWLLMHSVSFRLWVLKLKYVTFLLEMLAVRPRLQPWRLALMLMSCQLAWGWGKQHL